MRTTWTVLAGIVSVSSLTAASQAAVVLTPDVGSYTAGDGAIGTVTSSYVASTSYAKAGRTWLIAGTYETRGVVEIGIGSIPAGSVITSAYLDFGLASLDLASSSNLKIYGYAGNGTVETGDYGKASGSVLADLDPSTVLGSFSIDVTALIQDLVSQGKTYAGFVFKDTGSGFPASSYTLSNFYSTQYPSLSTGPRLVIEFDGGTGTPPVPEAASLGIIAAGATALLTRRRK